jgi:hypothetical protein
VQIVTVWALGIEPRHRSLEELKGDDTAPGFARRLLDDAVARMSEAKSGVYLTCAPGCRFAHPGYNV